jgi:hypothetical protein
LENSSAGMQIVEVTAVRTPEGTDVLTLGVLDGHLRIGARLVGQVVQSAHEQLAVRGIAVVEGSLPEVAHQAPVVPSLESL